jgi:hypothetical protein
MVIAPYDFKHYRKIGNMPVDIERKEQFILTQVVWEGICRGDNT